MKLKLASIEPDSAVIRVEVDPLNSAKVFVVPDKLHRSVAAASTTVTPVKRGLS